MEEGFKRRGQFWTHKGLGNLAALKQARERTSIGTNSGLRNNGGTDKVRPFEAFFWNAFLSVSAKFISPWH